MKLRPGFSLALLTICLWSYSALLISRLTSFPTLLLVGVALSTGGLVGIFRFKQWRVPPKTFAIGLLGMFVYHLLLVLAFRQAPAVEVNMINYLWPLLIVLLSPVILKGYALRFNHIAGALIGFAGAGLIFSGGYFSLDYAKLGGYLMATGAAVAWALYSLLTKRVTPFSSFAVGGFCLTAGLLSLGLFFVISISTQVPLPSPSPVEWLLLLLLGIGPNGIAFFLWDAALKRGDPRQIGTLTYLTPILSTFNLVVFGQQPFSPLTLAALVLIIAGAVIGSVESTACRRSTLA
jgi:drug/metabolite transporter (DMT)-like permease